MQERWPIEPGVLYAVTFARQECRHFADLWRVRADALLKTAENLKHVTVFSPSNGAVCRCEHPLGADRFVRSPRLTFALFVPKRRDLPPNLCWPQVNRRFDLIRVWPPRWTAQGP